MVKKEQLGVRYSVVHDPEDRQTDSRSQTGGWGGGCEMWERDTKSRGAVRRKEVNWRGRRSNVNNGCQQFFHLFISIVTWMKNR